jgi:hypothetical protein
MDRFREHIGQARSLQDHCHRWISTLLDEGLTPEPFVVRVLPGADRKVLGDWETFYISHHRFAGCPLTNIAPGGEGVGSGPLHPFYGKHQTEEAKALIAEASRRQEWTAERKEKISEALKGENAPWFGQASPFKGKKHTDETRKRISENQTGKERPSTQGDGHWTHQPGAVAPNTGRRWTDEQRERMAAAQRGRRIIGRKGKAVVCVDDGHEFASGQLAAEAYGMTKLEVSRCCRDGRPRHGRSFRFREASA